MQYKPHTAALITACAILTAMPATAAVQIKEGAFAEVRVKPPVPIIHRGLSFCRRLKVSSPMLWLQMPLLRSAETLH